MSSPRDASAMSSPRDASAMSSLRDAQTPRPLAALATLGSPTLESPTSEDGGPFASAGRSRSDSGNRSRSDSNAPSRSPSSGSEAGSRQNSRP
eukprot:4623516-Prymnesium_polylepis.1